MAISSLIVAYLYQSLFVVFISIELCNDSSAKGRLQNFLSIKYYLLEYLIGRVNFQLTQSVLTQSTDPESEYTQLLAKPQ